MPTASDVTEYFRTLRDTPTVKLAFLAKVKSRFSVVAPCTLTVDLSDQNVSVRYVHPEEGSVFVVELGCNQYHSPVSMYYSIITSWKEFPFPSTRHYPISSFETAEAAFDSLLDTFVGMLQKPASQGCVKAYTDKYHTSWFWKRPTSPNILMYEGNYYFVQTDTRIIQVYTATGVSNWAMMRSGLTRIQGQYWVDEALVSIYHNAFPFTEVARRMIPADANRYEFVLVDGERRYVDIVKVKNSITERPIHSYTTRIETLVEEKHLFLYGKDDLYSHREQGTTPFLGWELEACCNKSTAGQSETATKFKEYMPYNVICKQDGSIKLQGFEVVSVPATLDFWKESNLSVALNSMRVAPYNMRSFEHSSCGFHVHVSRAALSVLDLQKMERFVHNPDNRTFITEIAGRTANAYQNYYDKLFTDRSTKPVGNSTHRSIDGITFFGTKEEFVSGYAYALRVLPTNSAHRRERAFLRSMEDSVSYNSIRNLLPTLPTYVTWISAQTPWCQSRDELMSSFSYALEERNNNNSSGYSAALTGGVTTRTLPMFKELIVILATASREFCDYVNATMAYPETLHLHAPVAGTPTGTPSTLPAWKRTALLKTSASFRRSDSYRASQQVNGPVGKATAGRYDVLNTQNQNTVEFRLFKGTMNPTSIMRYLEFVDALVRFVADTSATNTGLSFQVFVKWLTSDSFNVARYENLISFIIEKKHLERCKVRRQVLPKVFEADVSTEPFVPPLPKGFVEEEARSLGSFTTASPVAVGTAVVSPNALVVDHYDEDEEEEEDDYRESCECEDCQAARGEI